MEELPGKGKHLARALGRNATNYKEEDDTKLTIDAWRAGVRAIGQGMRDRELFGNPNGTTTDLGAFISETYSRALGTHDLYNEGPSTLGELREKTEKAFEEVRTFIEGTNHISQEDGDGDFFLTRDIVNVKKEGKVKQMISQAGLLKDEIIEATRLALQGRKAVVLDGNTDGSRGPVR